MSDPRFAGAPGGRSWRLTSPAELRDDLERAFHGMALTRADGRTALTGHVRDQAELQGVLQRVSDFGLILLEARAIDGDPKTRNQP